MRYLPDPAHALALSPAELRSTFLVTDLFQTDRLVFEACDLDRVLLGGAVPASAPLDVGPPPETGSAYLTERRELGLLNLGGPGTVSVADTTYRLETLDALYVGRGATPIRLASATSEQPARFYLVSYPAHAAFPTTLVRHRDVEPVVLGSSERANRRRLYKYVHPEGVPSAQLVMGLTVLEEGSVWNTMPPHTHARRSEVYLYFGLAAPDVVVHLMGPPEATRSLVVRNEEAVLSPPWSIHAGAGTGPYAFCWAMGGENQAFDDVLPAPLDRLA